MYIIEIIKALVFGVVEGITEWLPISSTGHMILLNDVLALNVSEEFWNVFLVVIQLGAVLSVVILFRQEIIPITLKGGLRINRSIVNMWVKIIIACIPAGIVGVLWDDFFEAYFYNGISVAIALIVFGVGFIVIERRNQYRDSKVDTMDDISVIQALAIGAFQLLAAIFPGTSRSGATILGGLMIGVSRSIAARFTFFMAIPVMLGASLVKLIKFGMDFTVYEIGILAMGLASAFVVSIIVIRFLMGYIRKHDFKIFGWYRIALGLLVLIVTLV